MAFLFLDVASWIKSVAVAVYIMGLCGRTCLALYRVCFLAEWGLESESTYSRTCLVLMAHHVPAGTVSWLFLLPLFFLFLLLMLDSSLHPSLCVEFASFFYSILSLFFSVCFSSLLQSFAVLRIVFWIFFELLSPSAWLQGTLYMAPGSGHYLDWWTV